MIKAILSWHTVDVALPHLTVKLFQKFFYMLSTLSPNNHAQSINKWFPWRKWWATGVPTFDLQCSEIHSFVHPRTPGGHDIQIIIGKSKVVIRTIRNLKTFLQIHEQFSNAKLIKHGSVGCFGCSGASCSFQVKDCSAPDSHLGVCLRSFVRCEHTTHTVHIISA